MAVQRGRKGIEVSGPELQKAIAELEANGAFPNRSALWAALEESEWAKSRSPRPLTGQVAMNLAKKYGTTIATPVGMRGRAKGSGPIPGGGRRKKMLPLHMVEAMKNATPTKYHDVVDRVARGSMKAAIKLKCLDCSNWQQKEIRYCPMETCSLWPSRPYKDKPIEDTNRRVPIALATLVGVLGT